MRVAESAARMIHRPPEPRSQAEIRSLHQQILARLSPAPMAEDQLIRDLALPAMQIAPELLALELDGQIERQSGGLLSRRN
jgi:DNA processing protein